MPLPLDAALRLRGGGVARSTPQPSSTAPPARCTVREVRTHPSLCLSSAADVQRVKVTAGKKWLYTAFRALRQFPPQMKDYYRDRIREVWSGGPAASHALRNLQNCVWHADWYPPAIPLEEGGGGVTLTGKHRKYQAPKKFFLRLYWNCCSFSGTVV